MRAKFKEGMVRYTEEPCRGCDGTGRETRYGGVFGPEEFTIPCPYCGATGKKPVVPWNWGNGEHPDKRAVRVDDVEIPSKSSDS